MPYLFYKYTKLSLCTVDNLRPTKTRDDLYPPGAARGLPVEIQSYRNSLIVDHWIKLSCRVEREKTCYFVAITS